MSQIDWADYEKLKRMQARRRRRTERALYRDKHPIALTWVRRGISAFIQRKQRRKIEALRKRADRARAQVQEERESIAALIRNKEKTLANINQALMTCRPEDRSFLKGEKRKRELYLESLIKRADMLGTSG